MMAVLAIRLFMGYQMDFFQENKVGGTAASRVKISYDWGDKVHYGGSIPPSFIYDFFTDNLKPDDIKNYLS